MRLTSRSTLEPEPTSSANSLPPAPGVVRRRLLRWAQGNLRSFPWRETRDPYSVLIAEVLLRKTTARTATTVYQEFLRRFPTPLELAGSSVSDLAMLLAPLGLSNQRAEQLAALGDALISLGGVPTDAGPLGTLPGVGPYAAAAVRCFAFGKAVPMVDTNVARVISRVFGITPTRFEARRCPSIWEAAACLVRPSRAPERLNWSILDLAAALCKPHTPLCHMCPLANNCTVSTARKHS